jgi:hypothetical protein
MLHDLAATVGKLRPRLQAIRHAIERILVFEARDGAEVLRAARTQRTDAGLPNFRTKALTAIP